MKKSEMLKRLVQAEREVRHIGYHGIWNSLDVDYEPPHVERLWRHSDHATRTLLHRIHPCDTALFHPHPWPSAVRVVSGQYEMGIGYGAGEEAPREIVTTILSAGSAYEMIDPDAWHYVRPLSGPSLSIMVTGPTWGRWSPKPEKKLMPLTNEAKQELLDEFLRLMPFSWW